MQRIDRTFFSTALQGLALTALLALVGCAPQQGAARKDVALPMTESARVSYDYLVYQDLLHQLQRHAAGGEEDGMSVEQVNALHSQAAEALDRVLAAAPTPQLFVEKAGLYWNHPEGTGRSRAALKEGLEQFPDNSMLTVYLANSYIADNRVDDAVAVMDDYLSRHGDDVEAREHLGQMLMDAGQDAKALDVLKQIPEKERTPDALYTMGRVQGNLGMRKSAINNLKKAVAMDPEFTEALVELAYQYELAKDYVAAEEIYASILAQSDSFPEARLRLINLNLKLNDPGKALELALNGPPTKSFILDAVLMFVNDGFFAQGSTVLDMLNVGGAVPAEYFFYKAVIADEGESDPDKAIGFLDQVDRNDRLYPHALRFKAQILNAQGKAGEALLLATDGKRLFPDAAIFYILEASLLRQNDDLEGAEETLKQGLERLKQDPELTYELAMVYEGMGRRPEGLALMETVIRAHPDHATALNYVGYTLAEEGRELDRALVLVTKASSLDPENGYILDSVAWVHFKLKNLDKAWEYIRYAVDVVDKDPVVWEHYGDIAAAMGKKKEARKGYNFALKFNSPEADAVKEKLKQL